MHIDLVLPCYNPSAGWEHVIIERYADFCKLLPDSRLQLIIVDDGSHRGVAPGSEHMLREAIPDLRWITYSQNRGKGFALREGLRASTAPLVIYTDIDFPYTIDSMIDITRALRTDAVDLAIGVRDASYYEKIPASRRWISKLLRGLNRLIFGLKVADTQCGLKGMSMTGKQLFLETTIDRYLFDLELVMQASRNRGVRLQPVPVYLEEGVELSPVQASLLFNELKNLFRLFIKRWF